MNSNPPTRFNPQKKKKKNLVIFFFFLLYKFIKIYRFVFLSVAALPSTDCKHHLGPFHIFTLLDTPANASNCRYGASVDNFNGWDKATSHYNQDGFENSRERRGG